MGGVARRATVVEQERAAVAHVLLLDAGDTLSSDRPLARQSLGKIVIQAMNLMGYDAMAVGERDLQLGPQVLRQRMAEASFPFLAANLELEGELFAEPYVIKEAGEHRVAIVGLTGMIPNPLHGFEVRDPLETAQTLVAELRPQADIIVLLVHVGQEMEQRLKREIQGIDVMIGGSGQPRTSSALWDQAAGVLILPSEQPSPGHAGRLIGLAKVLFDGSGRLTSHESQMISLRPDIVDDPDVTLLVERYRQNQ